MPAVRYVVALALLLAWVLVSHYLLHRDWERSLTVPILLAIVLPLSQWLFKPKANTPEDHGAGR